MPNPVLTGLQNAGGYGYGPRWDEAAQSFSGPPKGLGYFGPLTRPDDPNTVMSEYSLNGDINGKPTEYPSIVPTLSKDELTSILNSKEGQPLPQSVLQKAQAYATQRVNAGQSPFAEWGEQQMDIYPDLPRQAVSPSGIALPTALAGLKGSQ